LVSEILMRSAFCLWKQWFELNKAITSNLLVVN